MQYLLLIYGREAEWGKLPDAEKAAIYREYGRFTDEIRARGQYVGGNPLEPVSTATTVRVRDGKTLTTDGRESSVEADTAISDLSTTYDLRFQRMKPRMLSIAALLVVAAAAASPDDSSDIAAARALFERNLAAIERRDSEAYLACYLKSETLARTGVEGPALGYGDFARSVGKEWPDTFEAADLRLVPVRRGLVYGTYRYRVRYGAVEQSGLSERFFLSTPDGWRIAVTTAFPAPPGTPPPPRAITGATLVDGTGRPPVPSAVVLLRDGKVECAGRDCAVPAGVAVTDARGLWITPGLVDAHVHFSQTGWADGRPDALDVRDRHPYEATVAELERHPERFFRADLCSGVTAVFDVGGYAWTLGLPARARSDPRAPHVAAAGPLLATIDHWVNLPGERQFLYAPDAEAARAGVRYLASRGADAVKVWYIVTPERSVAASEPAVLAAGEAARAAKLPLIVHATGLAEAKVALRAGAHLLVHGVSDVPVDDEFLDLARRGNTVYCPTLTVYGGYLRLAKSVAKRAPDVDDPNGCVDPGTLAKVRETASLPASADLAARIARQEKRVSDSERVGAANLKRAADAGIAVAMGTDAGNPLTLHGASVFAEMEAMQTAGLTPTQVLVAATRGGSLAMGRQKDLGTVEKGKTADLLLVAGDPTRDIANLRRIRFVVRGGVLRSAEELRAAVAAAGPDAARD